MQCSGCHSAMVGQVVQLADETIYCYSCGDCHRLWLEGSEATNLDAAYQEENVSRTSDHTCFRCRGVFLETLKEQVKGTMIDQCRECNGMYINLTDKFEVDHNHQGLPQFLAGIDLIYQRRLQAKKAGQLPKRFQIDQARETDLACPACSEALTHYRVREQGYEADAMFEICDACFGIWLDKEDLVDRGGAGTEPLAVDFQSIVPSSRTCPKCRDTKLIAMRFKGLSTVIDCCSACFGTWLDGGELNEFCEHLGRHGQDVIDSLVDNAVFRQPALCKVLKRFSKTLHDLDSQVQEQERNVEQARDIQLRLLFNNHQPSAVNIKSFSDYRVAMSWHPASGVGGDYFDLIPFSRDDRDYLGLCIADVSGKGLPASLLMANLQALLRSFAPSTLSPAQLCTQLNSVLHANTSNNKFITLFYGLLDLADGTMTYTNAGHNAPLLARDGELIQLNTGGTVLGLFPAWKYTEKELTLAAGERILFFTDGVTEAESPEGEEYGDDRLNQRFAALSGEAIETAVMQLGRAVKEFNMGDYNDDTTMLLLEKNALE